MTELYDKFKRHLDKRAPHKSYRYCRDAIGTLQMIGDGVGVHVVLGKAVNIDRTSPTLIVYPDGEMWFHDTGCAKMSESNILRYAVRAVRPDLTRVCAYPSPTIKIKGRLHVAWPAQAPYDRSLWKDPEAYGGWALITHGPIWITKDGFKAIESPLLRTWDQDKRKALLARLKFLREQLTVRSELEVFGPQEIRQPAYSDIRNKDWLGTDRGRLLADLDFEDPEYETKFRLLVPHWWRGGATCVDWPAHRRKQIELAITRLTEKLRLSSGAVSYLTEIELREIEDAKRLVVQSPDGVRAMPAAGQVAVPGQDSGARAAA